ncbi:MAG: hypothetical protein Q4F80_09200 [bacterium]|nr:hypothetical protein [bacterium]
MQADKENTNKKICKILGEIVSELKGKKRKTTLAYESDIPRSVLHYIMEGIKDPQLTTFMRLAIGLNLKPSELLKMIENRIGDDVEL